MSKGDGVLARLGIVAAVLYRVSPPVGTDPMTHPSLVVIKQDYRALGNGDCRCFLAVMPSRVVSCADSCFMTAFARSSVSLLCFALIRSLRVVLPNAVEGYPADETRFAERRVVRYWCLAIDRDFSRHGWSTQI